MQQKWQGLRARHDEMQAFQRRLKELTPHIPVTAAILGLNVLAFIAVLVLGGRFLAADLFLLVDAGANHVSRTSGGEWWRLFTGMFLHDDIYLLIFNLVFVALLGSSIERMLGSIGFAVMYVVTGLLSGMAEILVNWTVVSFNAVGAIAGCCGALCAIIIRDRKQIPEEMLTAVRKGAMLFSGLVLLIYFFFSWIAMLEMLGVGIDVPFSEVAGVFASRYATGLMAGFVAGLVLASRLAQKSAATHHVRSAGLAVGAALVLVLLAPFLPRTEDPLPYLRASQETLTEARMAYAEAVKVHAPDQSALSAPGRRVDFQRDLSTRIFPIVMRLNSPLPPIDRVPRGARDMIQEMSSRAARVAEAFVALDKALASGDSKRAWRLAREVSWTFDLSFFEILLRRHGRDS